MRNIAWVLHLYNALQHDTIFFFETLARKITTKYELLLLSPICRSSSKRNILLMVVRKCRALDSISEPNRDRCGRRTNYFTLLSEFAVDIASETDLVQLARQ